MATYNKFGEPHVSHMDEASVHSIEQCHSVSIESENFKRTDNGEHELQCSHVRETEGFIGHGRHGAHNLAQGFNKDGGNQLSNEEFSHREHESLSLDIPDPGNTGKGSSSTRETRYYQTEERLPFHDRVQPNQEAAMELQHNTRGLDQAQMTGDHTLDRTQGDMYNLHGKSSQRMWGSMDSRHSQDQPPEGHNANRNDLRTEDYQTEESGRFGDRVSLKREEETDLRHATRGLDPVEMTGDHTLERTAQGDTHYLHGRPSQTMRGGMDSVHSNDQQVERHNTNRDIEDYQTEGGTRFRHRVSPHQGAETDLQQVTRGLDQVQLTGDHTLDGRAQEDMYHSHGRPSETMRGGMNSLQSRDQQEQVAEYYTREDIDHHDDSHRVIDLLKLLELEEFYPEKITLQHVMEIGDLESKSKSASGRVPWNILQNLIMLDQKGINRQVQNCVAPNTEDASTKEETDFASLSSDSDDEDGIHPSDIFIPIFACCDLNLRQILIQKMHQCRLGLPFLFPDVQSGELTFNLWALRSTTLVWRDSSDKAREASAVEHPLHTVSCLGLGRPTLSKSQLLNNVISEHHHETFLNKDSPNGDCQRQLTKGLVEASFFLPSGRENDVSKEPTIFLNLRGDAVQHGKQVEILSQISNVVIVSLDIRDLKCDDVIESMKSIHHHCSKIIMIIGNEYQLAKKDQKTFLKYYQERIGQTFSDNITKIGLKEKNSSQITDEVRSALYKTLTDESGKVLQKATPFISSHMVKIDEMNQHCQEGKHLAERALSERHKNASRTELVPLQGQDWKEWCRLLKSKKRRKSADGGIQKVGSEEELMKRHRLQQLSTNLSPFMHTFIEGLQIATNSEGNSPTTDFYLQWLKIYLDDASRQKLSPLQGQYHEKLRQLRSLKKGQVKDTHILKTQLRDIEKKIDDSTLGLEHLMREMGQIYEAAIESPDKGYKQWAGSLPKLAADLLLGGHSLEILDGDASGVPLSWLQAVFKELELKIGNKKLFTLSVLGVQSSGKSTLLNTMFGLQFPVSAGRCTRGVYIQLVKVKYSKSLPFSYLAVLDTEGLRAQEIGESKYDHDNELATFVIGLGTLTLINVKGENVAEIKDILQIVAHAFLRMKMVNKDIQKERACLFVHQNVPAVDAKEKMKEGEQKFQETLDKKTLEAAKLENISDVHCFSDVIQFDNQRQVWYFPDLWFGDPPMASVNTGYHEKVKELRSAFLSDIVRDQKCLFRFSQLLDFIRDMWYGVLADDFVFSFRNSIVAKARKDLDLKFSELKWELELCMKEWLNNIQWQRGTQSDFKKHCQDLKRKATETIASKQSKVILEMERFIDAREEMHPWKEETKAALEFAADSILRSTKKDVDKIAETTAFKNLKDREQDKHKEAILKKARQLAEQMKDKALDDQMITQEFETMWDAWINSIDLCERSNDIPIVKQLEEHLFEEFKSERVILHNELQKNPLGCRKFKASLADSLTFTDIEVSVSDAVKTKEATREKPKKSWFSCIFSRSEEANYRNDPRDIVVKEIKDIFKSVDSTLRTLPKESGFHIHDAQAIFKQIRYDLRKLNLRFDRSMSIPTDVEVRLVAMVASYSDRVFQEMQNAYDQNYSLKAQLEAYKEETWNMFLKTVKQVKDEIIIVDLICGEIQPLVETAVMKKLRIEVLKEIMSHFKGKASLIKAVLIDLAEDEDFGNYQEYIANSKSFTTDWLEKYIGKYLFQHGSQSWYSKKSRDLTLEVITEVEQCLENAFSTQNTSMDKWIRNFSKGLSRTIDFTGKNALALATSTRCEVRGTKEPFKKRLGVIETQAFSHFSQHTMADVNRINSPPHVEIMNSLWGCEAICPFCNEPCKRPDQNHASPSNCHECLQHRPQGAAAWSWIGTKKIVVENCSYNVQSLNSFRCSGVEHTCEVTENRDTTYHPYRDYKTHVPNWNIPPSADMDSSHYWMWYLNKFQHKIAEAQNLELPDIPASWKDITKGSALDSLSLYD